ncbi:MAG TPA: hypothetical protein PLZ58_03900 [Candidatus Saccharibacteria bacterium]|nr:hypothetical protein [Candidatus Saccharibacteria bacterium]
MTFEEWAKDYFAKFPASEDNRCEYAAAKAAWDAAHSVEVNTGPIKASDMTLRDNFAGLAMQGAMANCEVKEKAMSRAQWAYEIADAMMKERLK